MGLFGRKTQSADLELRDRLVRQGIDYVLTQHNEGRQAFGPFVPELTQKDLDAAGLDGLTLLQSVGSALAALEPPVAVHMYNVPTGRNVLGNVIDTVTLASVIAIGDVDMRIDAPPAERDDVYVPQMGREIEPAALGIVALARRDPTRLDQIAVSLNPADMANPSSPLHQ